MPRQGQVLGKCLSADSLVHWGYRATASSPGFHLTSLFSSSHLTPHLPSHLLLQVWEFLGIHHAGSFSSFISNKFLPSVLQTLKSLIHQWFSFCVWHSFWFILFFFPYHIFNGVPIHVFSYRLGQDASLLVIILNKGPLLHACLLTQLCLTVCKPVDCSPPNFCVSGTFQARLLPFIPPEDLPAPRIKPGSPVSPALAGEIFFLMASLVTAETHRQYCYGLNCVCPPKQAILKSFLPIRMGPICCCWCNYLRWGHLIQ